MRSALFIDEVPTAKISRNLVRTVAKSGGETFERVFDLHTWRQFIENEAARLREHDRIEGQRVVAFPRKKRTGH